MKCIIFDCDDVTVVSEIITTHISHTRMILVIKSQLMMRSNDLLESRTGSLSEHQANAVEKLVQINI